jgi:predicted transposase YdaD
MMQWVPISEARRELAIKNAVEENSIEIAREMRADGFSAETIAKYTKLDKDDILSLG